MSAYSAHRPGAWPRGSKLWLRALGSLPHAIPSAQRSRGAPGGLGPQKTLLGHPRQITKPIHRVDSRRSHSFKNSKDGDFIISLGYSFQCLTTLQPGPAPPSPTLISPDAIPAPPGFFFFFSVFTRNEKQLDTIFCIKTLHKLGDHY